MVNLQKQGLVALQDLSKQDILDILDEIPRGFKDLWNGDKYVVGNPEVFIFGSSFYLSFRFCFLN